MPSQQAEIAETIAALRRARDREKKAPSTRPIYAATNRGQKLYRGAEYVRTGSLAYTYGPERHKEKIDHAGYSRYILDRIPNRYDNYGNELEHSEEDADADVEVAEQNPYNGILLEELLGPLKHPRDLAVHPSLSRPYFDPALRDMARSTEQRLQQERANLSKAKNLNRQFFGDINWLPCEAVETIEDWDMFEPRSTSPAQSKSGKRKRDDNRIVSGDDLEIEKADMSLEEPEPKAMEQDGAAAGSPPNNALTTGGEIVAGEDISIADTDQTGANGVNQYIDVKMTDPEKAAVPNSAEPLKKEENLQDTGNMGNSMSDRNGVDPPAVENPATADVETSDSTSPAQPTRRITRALAANTNGSNPPTPHLSPTSALTDSSSSSLYQADPIFLLPAQLSAPGSAARGSSFLTSLSGLSIEEATDIRKLLTMYIQKQEESVRGYEAVLGKLIKAKRMKEDVLEMCKAEGHICEMSDGEDWIDTQKWGLGPGELKKGKDEEDEAGDEREVTGIGGRKGKRRRN